VDKSTIKRWLNDLKQNNFITIAYFEGKRNIGIEPGGVQK
jgi:hypothetical protein